MIARHFFSDGVSFLPPYQQIANLKIELKFVTDINVSFNRFAYSQMFFLQMHFKLVAYMYVLTTNGSRNTNGNLIITNIVMIYQDKQQQRFDKPVFEVT